MFRTLIGSAATIALSAALITAPAIAHHDPGHSQGGGGGGGDSGRVAVDATFTVNPGDRIQSDDIDNASYDGVIDSSRFKIDFLAQGRNLFLDFSDCASPGECAPPFESGLPSRALAWLAVQLADGANLLQDPGPIDTEIRIRFEHGGVEWHLDFRPELSGCGAADDTHPITMTRFDLDTWDFEGTHSGGITSVACLREAVLTGNGKKTRLEFRGRYSMPFMVTATRQ